MERSLGKLSHKILIKRGLATHTIDTEDGLTITIKRKQSALSPHSSSADDENASPKKKFKKVSFASTIKGAVSPSYNLSSMPQKFHDDFWDDIKEAQPVTMKLASAQAPTADTKTIKAEKELLDFLDTMPKQAATITSTKNDKNDDTIHADNDTSASHHPVSLLDEEEEASSPNVFYAVEEEYDEDQWKAAVEEGRIESVDW